MCNMGTARFVAVMLLISMSFHQSFGDDVIVEVAGFGVFNGTEETSTYTERPFLAFRSIFYAEKPTPDIRFLVTDQIIQHLK